MTNKFFLTGQPGSGKSTLFHRCIERLKESGFKVGGIVTPEIRERGRRVGFNVVDLASREQAILAKVDISSRFRVGKYGVDLMAFESVALPALVHAEKNCDLIGIDEIGRMELFSKQFKLKVEELIRGPKALLAVLHRNYIREYGKWGCVLHITPENRENLIFTVVSGLMEYL